ncbi:MAG: protein-export chaperone SecB [Rickettsiales bacterium]|jgi:preprotein translocase subunit SecB|nr:protein-export chaperone SecB [Rickettsiales bacterium]
MLSKRNGAEIILNIQYLKDLNFENPQAPSIYGMQNLKPETKVSFDLNAIKLQNEVFEVEIVINIAVGYGDEEDGANRNNMFSLDAVYAGIFTIRNVSDTEVQENLFVDCPTLIFPFFRRIVADTTRDANFPPLMLDMIDFEKIYSEKKSNLKK